jgi:hypothetical protein
MCLVLFDAQQRHVPAYAPDRTTCWCQRRADCRWIGRCNGTMLWYKEEKKCKANAIDANHVLSSWCAPHARLLAAVPPTHCGTCPGAQSKRSRAWLLNGCHALQLWSCAHARLWLQQLQGASCQPTRFAAVSTRHELIINTRIKLCTLLKAEPVAWGKRLCVQFNLFGVSFRPVLQVRQPESVLCCTSCSLHCTDALWQSPLSAPVGAIFEPAYTPYCSSTCMAVLQAAIKL